MSTMGQQPGYDYYSRSLKVTTFNTETGEYNVFRTTSGGYQYLHLSATTTGTSVKGSAGVLHAITINNIGSAVTITLYDGTSTSGNEIGILGGTLSFGTVLYDVSFTTGLFIVVAATTAPDCTITFE